MMIPHTSKMHKLRAKKLLAETQLLPSTALLGIAFKTQQAALEKCTAAKGMLAAIG
jgi:hypothetical protein